MTTKAKEMMFTMFLAGFSARLDEALSILQRVAPVMLLGNDKDKRMRLLFFKDVKEEFSLAAEIIVEEGDGQERKTLQMLEQTLPEIDKATFKVLNTIKEKTAEEDFQFENLNQIYYENHM